MTTEWRPDIPDNMYRSDNTRRRRLFQRGHQDAAAAIRTYGREHVAERLRVLLHTAPEAWRIGASRAYRAATVSP